MPNKRNQKKSRGKKNKQTHDDQTSTHSRKTTVPVYSVESLQVLLREYYSQKLSIIRLLYDSMPIPIERHYVELTMTSKQDYEERLKSLQNLRPSDNRDESYETYDKLYGQTNIPIISDLLTTDITCFTLQGRVPDSTKIPGQHHMLFTGTPGVGKSTFTDYLCFLWGRKTGYHDYHWVFRVSLRNLTDERYPKGKEYSAIDIIIKECFEPILERPLTKSEMSELKEKIMLANDKNRVLIVLDGYDEVEEQLPPHLQFSLKEFFSFYRVILTSRPYNLHGLGNYGFRPTAILEITGFSPQNIDNYVAKFFTHLQPPRKEEIPHVLKFIKSNPNIAGTCRIPINVELVCSAWEQLRMSETYCTMSYLYQRVLISLSIRYLKNKNKENSARLKNLDPGAILALCQTQIGFLEHFAFQTLLDNKLFIEVTQTLQYLASHQSTMPSDSADIIAEQKIFGFIKTDVPDSPYDGISRYYFSHLTLRDFFAARYIASVLQQEVNQHTKKPISIVSPFRHKWVSLEDTSVAAFIQRHKFSGQYEIIWWFVAGLLAESKDVITLKHFFSLLVGEQYDISHIYTVGLLIRCLDEANYYLEQFPDEMIRLIIHWIKWFLTPKSSVVLSQNNIIWQRLRLSRNLFLRTNIQKYLTDTLEEVELSILEHLLITLIQMGQMLTKDLTLTTLNRVIQELEKDENTLHQKLNFQKLFQYFLNIFSLLPPSEFEDFQQIKIMLNLLSVITSTPPNPAAYNAILVLLFNSSEMKLIHLKAIDHALDNLCQIKGATVNAPILENLPLKEQHTLELFQKIEKENIFLDIEHQMLIFKFLLLAHFHFEQNKPFNQRIQKRSLTEFEKKHKEKINAIIIRYTEIFSNHKYNIRTRTTALRLLLLIPCLTPVFSQLVVNYHSTIISQLLQKDNPLRELILNELIVRNPFFAPQPLNQLCNALHRILNDQSESNTIRILTLLCLELYYNELIFLKKYDELLLNLACNSLENTSIRINAMIFFLRRRLGPPSLPMNYEEGESLQGLLNQNVTPTQLRWLAAMALFLWHKRTSAVIQLLLQRINWETLEDNPLDLTYYQQTTILCYQRIRQSIKMNEIDELLHSSLIIEAHYLPLAYMLGKAPTESILQFILAQKDLSRYHSLILVIMVRHIEFGKPFYLNRQDNKLYYYENQRYSSISLKDLSYDNLQSECRLALQELLQIDTSLMNSELVKSLNQIPGISTETNDTSRSVSNLSSPLSSSTSLSPSTQMASNQAGRDNTIIVFNIEKWKSKTESPLDDLIPSLQQKIQAAKQVLENPQSIPTELLPQNHSNVITRQESSMRNYSESPSLPRGIDATIQSQRGLSLPERTVPAQERYYQILLEELRKLNSEALPDAWGTEDQLMHYIRQIIRGRADIVLCSYVWNLSPTSEELSAQLESVRFPLKEFIHQFILNAQVKKFILPLISHSHFVGVNFVKTNSPALFEIRYFNPTGENPPVSGEDKEILDKIKQSLINDFIQFIHQVGQLPSHQTTDSIIGQLTVEQIQSIQRYYPHKLTMENIQLLNFSDKQQKNGSDCVYIVGQTLGEIALDQLRSISRFDEQDPQSSLQPIAQARARFCDAKIMEEARAYHIVRDQLLNRLGKALTENGPFAQELRELLQRQSKPIGQLNEVLWIEMRTLAQRIDLKDGLKGMPGTVIVDQAIHYLHSSSLLKSLSNQDIRLFCDALLVPHFPEHGDVIFELNRELVAQSVTANSGSSQEQFPPKNHTSTSLVSGIQLSGNQNIINVSGHNNNCGLFALVLGIQLESQLQPSKLPESLRYLVDIPSEALQTVTPQTPNIGPLLREILSHVLSQDISFKEGRRINFVACASDYLDKKNISSLESDMAALIEPRANQAILQEMLTIWSGISSHLQSCRSEDFLKQIEQQTISADEINSFCQMINRLIIDIDEQDSKGKIYQLFKVDNVAQMDSIEALIKLRKLYRAANASNALGQAPSPMHQKWFDEAVNRFFTSAYRAHLNKGHPLLTEKLFIFALLEEIHFDIEGKVSKIPQRADVLKTSKSLFADYHLLPKWEQIYKTSCEYIKTSLVMLTADELGQLVRHWGIQLIVHFNNGRTYHSHEVSNASVLQVTLCNPSFNHWQVILNHSLPQVTSKAQSASFASPLTTDSKIHSQSSKELTMYNAEHHLPLQKPAAASSFPLATGTTSTTSQSTAPSHDAAAEFDNLLKEGLTWDDIKKEFVMGRFEEKKQREIASQRMKGFISLREVIDYRIYRQAIETIFPGYNLTAEVRGEIKQKGDRVVFSTSWYEFIVTAKPDFKPVGSSKFSECRIRINAPGSRTLTSDIDTSIYTTFVNIENFNFQNTHERVKDYGPDYAGRVTNAVIDFFYRFSETEFHVTSAEHRDSNAYIDLMTEDTVEYPKFQNDETYNPIVGGQKLFSDAEITSAFFLNKPSENIYSFKTRKHQWEMAASLFSLRQALDADGWNRFKRLVQATAERVLPDELGESIQKPEVVTNLQRETLRDMDSVFQLTEQLHTTFQNDMKAYQERHAEVFRQYRQQSLLKGEALERDVQTVTMNRLYVHYLEQMVDCNNQIYMLTLENQQLIKKLDEVQQRLSKEERKLKHYAAAKEDFAEEYPKCQQACATLMQEIDSYRKTLKGNYIRLAERRFEKLTYRIQAHCFANEAYVNRSAVYHVVRGMQQSGDVAITQQTLLNSVLHQVGFKLLHSQELRKRHKPEGEIAYLTAKYGRRIYHLLFKAADKEVEDTLIASLYRRNRDDTTVGILNRLKASERTKSYFYRTFNENELRLLNLEMKIVSQIKGNDRIPDNQKPVETSRLIQTSNISNTDDLFINIAAKVICLTYVARLDKKQVLWGHSLTQTLSTSVVPPTSVSTTTVSTSVPKPVAKPQEKQSLPVVESLAVLKELQTLPTRGLISIGNIAGNRMTNVGSGSVVVAANQAQDMTNVQDDSEATRLVALQKDISERMPGKKV